MSRHPTQLRRASSRPRAGRPARAPSLPSSFALWLGVLLLFAAGASGAQERPRVRVGDLILEAPLGWEPQLDQMAAAARDLIPRLESDLGHGTSAPFRIVLLPARSRLEAPELVRLDELAPRWASGYLLGAYRIGAIRLQQLHRYPVDDAVEVLAHEITHMILFDAAGPGLPRWFSEGVATWEGRRRGLRDLAITTASLLLTDPPPLAALDRELDASPARARRAYATSFAFLEWSVRRHGHDLVPHLLDELAGARSDETADGDAALDAAWREVTGSTLASEERRWRRRALWIHRWIPALAGSGTLWIAITLLFLVATAARRRRTRALYRRWAEEDLLVRPIELDLSFDTGPAAEGDESDDGDEDARRLIH